jgi:hypothetical protein
VSHYHGFLCARFCAHTDWTSFVTLLNSCSKESTERLILLNPKHSLVGPVKSRAIEFQHDAHPMNESQPHKPTVIFFRYSPCVFNSVRDLGTLNVVLFQESVRVVDVFASYGGLPQWKGSPTVWQVGINGSMRAAPVPVPSLR